MRSLLYTFASILAFSAITQAKTTTAEKVFKHETEIHAALEKQFGVGLKRLPVITDMRINENMMTSFIDLDNLCRLLTGKNDSRYVGGHKSSTVFPGLPTNDSYYMIGQLISSDKDQITVVYGDNVETNISIKNSAGKIIATKEFSAEVLANGRRKADLKGSDLKTTLALVEVKAVQSSAIDPIKIQLLRCERKLGYFDKVDSDEIIFEY